MQITSDSPQTSPNHSIQEPIIRRRCNSARTKSSDLEHIRIHPTFENLPPLPSSAVVLSSSSTAPIRPARAILPPPNANGTAPPLPPRPATNLKGKWSSPPYKVLGKNPPPPPPKDNSLKEEVSEAALKQTDVQEVLNPSAEKAHAQESQASPLTKSLPTIAPLNPESSNETLSSFLGTAQAVIQESPSSSSPLPATVHMVAAQTLSPSPKEAALAVSSRSPSITLTETVHTVAQGPLSNPSNEAVYMSTQEIRLPSVVSTSTACSTNPSSVSSSMGTVSSSHTSTTSSTVSQTASNSFSARHAEEEEFVPKQRLIAKVQTQQKETLRSGDNGNDNKLKELDALDDTFRKQETALNTKLRNIGAFKSVLENKVKAIYGEGYQCNETDKAEFADKAAFYATESKSLIELRTELQQTSDTLTRHITEYASSVNPKSANLAELALKLGVNTQSYLRVQESWQQLNNEWIRQKNTLDTAISNLNQNDVEIRGLLGQFQQRVAPEDKGLLSQLAASITGSVSWVISPFAATGPNTTPFSTTTMSARKSLVTATAKT